MRKHRKDYASSIAYAGLLLALLQLGTSEDFVSYTLLSWNLALPQTRFAQNIYCHHAECFRQAACAMYSPKEFIWIPSHGKRHRAVTKFKRFDGGSGIQRFRVLTHDFVWGRIVWSSASLLSSGAQLMLAMLSSGLRQAISVVACCLQTASW